MSIRRVKHFVRKTNVSRAADLLLPAEGGSLTLAPATVQDRRLVERLQANRDLRQAIVSGRDLLPALQAARRASLATLAGEAR